MPNPPPKVMRAEEWYVGTAKTFAKRGTLLTKLDVALFAYERRPNPETLEKLKAAFTAWIDAKGGLDKALLVKRNKRDTVTLLHEQLYGDGESGSLPLRLDLNRAGMIDARRGVVYLFSHMDIKDGIFNIIMHGAIDLASASVSFASATQTIADEAKGIDPTKDAELTAQGKASTGLGLTQKATDFAAPKIEKKLAKSQALPFTGTDLAPKKIPYTFFNTPTPEPTDSKLRQIWNWLVEHLANLANKVIAIIRAKALGIWGDKSAAAMEYLPKIARTVINKILAKWLASAAPIIGGILEIGGGILNTMTAAAEKYKEWVTGKGVELMGGHPSTVAQAIRNAMWLSVGEGLYNTLKGGVNLGINFAAAGASAIVSLVISVVEAVATTCWHLVEIMRIRTFFDEARDMWKRIDNSDSLHLQPTAFNKWYSSYALTIPALAVLTLISGICGDKMRYLQMYKADDHVIDQSAFDHGVTYLDNLKIWGYEYLDNAGFSFESSDPLVTHMLELGAENKKLVELTHGERFLKVAANFLG